MPKVKRSRKDLTEEQTEVLKSCWEKGMRDGGSPLISAAATSSGLSQIKVKKWINNYQHSVRRSQPVIKRVNSNRGPSGYNAFCSSLKNTDIGQFGSLWVSLSDDQKKQWEDTAKQNNLTKEKNEANLIKRLQKNISLQCDQLEEVGVNTGVILHHNNKITVLGNRAKFLEDQPVLLQNFVQLSESSEDYETKEDLRRKVQDIFNEKYSEFRGTQTRVQYNRGNDFTFVGLPAGIKFGLPSKFGKPALKKIIEAKDQIYVIRNEAPDPSSTFKDQGPSTSTNLTVNTPISKTIVPIASTQILKLNIPHSKLFKIPKTGSSNIIKLNISNP